MRQLITDDIYAMSRILGKLGVKPELKITNEDGKEKDDEEFFLDVMLDVATKVAGSLHLAQNEVNAFLADLSGMTPEEFGKLPIKESLRIMKEFKDLDGIKDFFELVGRLTSSE